MFYLQFTLANAIRECCKYGLQLVSVDTIEEMQCLFSFFDSAILIFDFDCIFKKKIIQRVHTQELQVCTGRRVATGATPTTTDSAGAAVSVEWWTLRCGRTDSLRILTRTNASRLILNWTSQHLQDWSLCTVNCNCQWYASFQPTRLVELIILQNFILNIHEECAF